MTHLRLRALPALLFLLALAAPARAQMFGYGRGDGGPVQSLSFGYTHVDFDYAGEGNPWPTFEYHGPAYGATYQRPGLEVSGSLGRATEQDTSRSLVDLGFLTWGEFRLTRAPAARIFIPVGLFTHYRRVRRDLPDTTFAGFGVLADAFSVTTLGLGAGLGAGARTGRHVRMEARVMPGIGFASRSVGDASGTALLLDASATVHVVRIAGRFGLTAGYGFRAQHWNLDTSGFFRRSDTRDFFDYKGSQHTFRLGFTF